MRGTRLVIITTAIAVMLTATAGVEAADEPERTDHRAADASEQDVSRTTNPDVTSSPETDDAVREHVREQVRERVHERTRPLCAGDDCVRPLPETRPILKRCIAWFLEHTTIEPHRRIAYWWLLCHRLWNHLTMM